MPLRLRHMILRWASLAACALGIIAMSPGCCGSATCRPPDAPRAGAAGRTFTKRFFLLVFNPLLETRGGRGLYQSEHWSNPYELVASYVRAVRGASHRSVNYVEAGRLEVDGYPVKEDGFLYDDKRFLECLGSHKAPACHKPGMRDGFGYAVDYPALLKKYGICEKLNRGQIHELWVFGAPFMGFWEANQAGVGAFFTNGPVVGRSTCKGTLDIMGFSYERGLAKMLENLGHRIEGTLRRVYGRGAGTAYAKFIRHEKRHPGGAHCGTIHYAPNSRRAYDWRSLSEVASRCDDWLDYPSLRGRGKRVTCAEWGCNAAGHKLWWLSHLPHAAGTAPDGKRANWWAYVVGAAAP